MAAAPILRDHVVARQVPPEVVVLVLHPPVDLPAAQHLKGLAIHDEDAGRALGAVSPAAAERRDVDPLRTTVDRMRPRVARLRENLLRLDDLVQRGCPRSTLDVDDVDPR